MTKDRVRNLIRKLYRTGQGRTPEAANARERIGKLTKKYGIDLRSVIDREKRLAGVAGDYWRSALLVSIAKSFDCQVLDQSEGKRRFAVVSGKWDDVSRTVDLYRLAEVRVAVQFTAWWRGESAKPATTFSPYSIPSQWPPPPRFTRQQEQQIKPILLRFMAVSVADTFAENVATSANSASREPPSGDGAWGVPTAEDGSWSVPTPPRDAARFKHRPPPKNFERPPPHGGDALDGEIQKLVAILGPDEAKVLGESALDSGATTAVALREMMRKPMLQLPANSKAFPRAKAAAMPADAQARARAQIAEHIRKVISRAR